jgi:hypothetical protein
MKKFLEADFDMHSIYMTLIGVVCSLLLRQPLYSVATWIFVLFFLLQCAFFSRGPSKWKCFFLSVLITAVLAGTGAGFSLILRRTLE